MVKSRAQIVNRVANDKCKVRRRARQGNADSPVRLYIGNDRLKAVVVPARFNYKITDVLFGPFDL